MEGGRAEREMEAGREVEDEEKGRRRREETCECARGGK